MLKRVFVFYGKDHFRQNPLYRLIVEHFPHDEKYLFVDVFTDDDFMRRYRKYWYCNEIALKDWDYVFIQIDTNKYLDVLKEGFPNIPVTLYESNNIKVV